MTLKNRPSRQLPRKRTRSSNTQAVRKVPAIAGLDSPDNTPAGRGQRRATGAGCKRRPVGDLDLPAARSAGPRRPAHAAAAQGRNWGGGGGGPRVGGARCTPCARPVGHGAGLRLLGAEPVSPLSRAAAVRSGHARTLHRPRSRYGPARPLAWRGARTGSEPGGRAWAGVGSPRVPGWEGNRGRGKGVGLSVNPFTGPGHGVRPSLGERVCY